MKGKVEACDGKEEAEKFKASNNCGFKGSRSAITLHSPMATIVFSEIISAQRSKNCLEFSMA